MTSPSPEIENAIAELTGVSGDGQRVYLAADIGNVGIDDIDWKFLMGQGFRKVTMPRAVFRYEREPDVNFWLVEMPARVAAIYGLSDLILSDEEAERHRKRFLATNYTNAGLVAYKRWRSSRPSTL